MNAKDKTAMDEAIALAITAATQPLILEINALQQRSSNFAARVNAHNKLLRGEVTALRDRLERIEPKMSPAREPLPARIPLAQWNAARASLGGGYHAPGAIRAGAERLAAQNVPAVEAYADEEEFTL